MSSDTVIAYFGVRFEVRADEIEGIELRSDARVVAARKAALKYYWGNFSGAGDQYLLFIGAEIGILGDENADEISLQLEDAKKIFDTVKRKINEAGFSQLPALHLKWQHDA